jgi:hypothetical protein
MSSGLEPSGPAQPTKADAYTESSNPATRNPSEQEASLHATRPSEGAEEVRHPSEPKAEGAPQPQARGVRGGEPVDQREAQNLHFLSHTARNKRPENPSVDGEQLSTLAEGDVADAVQRKSGTQRAPGQEPHADDYSSELGR